MSAVAPWGMRFASPSQVSGRSTADIDDEAADFVQASAVAGVEHDRRRDLLDDRGTGDLVAGEERLAMPDRRLMPSAAARSGRLEIDPAHALSRLGRRLAAAGGRARQFGRVDEPGGGDQESG